MVSQCVAQQGVRQPSAGPLPHVDAVGPGGSTALVMACGQGLGEAAEALMLCGADVNKEAQEHTNGNGNNTGDKKLRTPLMAACAHGDVALVTKLLEHKADPIQGKSDTGAVGQGHVGQQVVQPTR